ncbi:MAG: 16S rRNA (cytosine(1402)-N(4))-methyltransferase RsmH [candidate division KSB1 bacterium]|nr:16S rRNA (cytosine(1402)-N(4))-methyltransferase RsmH [candidate division KSB1 bacterium]MDZ7366281.1 16S rRNA (cytosine(1402)-N(4))-methyltransferase RsmH [candidate division KSB1 bacterium]MDZ7404499.1 16S rRNA (cytosine(1402)-N(4))-methyltransferase RsmH [candidate division KSB1 bacterium]
MHDRASRFHQPVLVEAVSEFLLAPNVNVIVDATLGDGGHTLALFEKGGAGLRVIGIDADAEALARAQARLQNYQERCRLAQGNFRSLTQVLGSLGVTQADGILADLGVSSRQIDQPERGFSYLADGPLDMRMNPDLPHTAAGLLARLEREELKKIFREYGEEKFAGPIATAIVKQRLQRSLQRTGDLRQVVEKVVKGPHRIKSLARIFQALRIAVNDELEALNEFLPAALAALRPGGRLAVISYHSLEDRIVKQFFKRQEKGCTCPAEFPACVCGKQAQVRILTSKPVTPGPQEIAVNSRARSARLRVAEKR